MGKLNFYVLWSLRDAPRQFASKSGSRSFHAHVPLPLPKQLVIFGLGEWAPREAAVMVDVVLGADVAPQRIGTLTSQVRCLTFEGDWRADVVTVAAQRSRKGVYGKIVLSVCGESPSSTQDRSTLLSSTPLAQRTRAEAGELSVTDLSCTLHHSITDEVDTLSASQLGDSVFSEIQVNTVDTSEAARGSKRSLWPTDKTPRRTVIGRRGHMTWSGEDMESLGDAEQASTPKKMRLSRMNSREEMTAQIKSQDREASVCPSQRWSHTMCLSDPNTAILMGGEAEDQNSCPDSLWKLELDNDFWYPMTSSISGPAPPRSRGHSATFDAESQAVYVYGGLREGQRYSELFVLDTLTWRWRLVSAKGNIPTLAYHSAVFYKRELFVFGGVRPGPSSADKSCSNSLYIFSPDDQLWYQPIVEGDKPTPRFGHSATLLSKKLLIFGGRKTATYLNDLHILDLGFMEYTAVKCGNMAPLPRGFHAASAVSDNRVLVSGGCSAVGALSDIHVFNTDTSTWSPLVSPVFSAKPRAGHSMIATSSTSDPETQKEEQIPLLVFGGSDCCGSFYSDTIRFTVQIPPGT
ncbi:uncharacterized protein ACB058_017994 [Synchiropus picturatus]